MSKRDDRTLLCDIHESIKRIHAYSRKLSRQKFIKDIKTQDAVIRNFEIIGEAAKGISSKTRARYRKIPWKDLAKFRDKLIHHYFGINIDMVWEIMETSLPAIAQQVGRIIRKERKSP